MELVRNRGALMALVEEAHYSLHPEGVGGRPLGPRDKGFCVVTYRASWLRGR